MLKYVFSYIWPENKANDLNKAYEVLQTVEEPKPKEQEQEVSDFTFENKVGTITGQKNELYIIDDVHYFHLENENYPIGQKISYMLIKEKDKTVVKNVKLVSDDSWIEKSDHKANWCTRIVVGQVNKRDGRLLYVHPDGICVDLNETASEFIPIVGDWVELEVKCEVLENGPDLFGDIISIIKIRPLRTKIFEGKIRDFNGKTGRIGIDTYFDLSAISDGYSPQNQDIVLAEVIESNQKKNLAWRALKVVLHNGNNKSTNKAFKRELPKLIKFEKNIKGVYITDNIHLFFDSLGESKTFKITIENKKKDMRLNSVKFDTQICQVKLKSGSFNETLIEQNKGFEIEFIATIKSMGESCETVIFLFEKFNIGRNIRITLKKPENKPKSEKTVDNYYKKQHSKNFFNINDASNEIVKGEKGFCSPRFVGGKMGVYKIPEGLQKVILEYDGVSSKNTEKYFDILKVCPCLKENLTFENYEAYFHSLLHLEEITLILGMRKYDQERVSFIKNDPYLMLEIENLAEQRPSIIIGDSVMASDPFSKDTNRKLFYEGCVNRVSSNHLYLKFASTFHNSYNGEDYSIQVKHSRTLFRKLHHAVHLAFKNLGGNILFPSKVRERKPQVIFTFDEYVDDLSFGEKKIPNLNSWKMNAAKLTPIKSNETDSSSVENNSTNVTVSPKIQKMTPRLAIKIIKRLSNEKKELEENESPKKELTPPIELEESNTKLKENNLAQKEANDNEMVINKSQNNDIAGDECSLKLTWFDEKLNYFQKEAVRNVLLGKGRPLPYIIFGPPGTGKTMTVIETILQILRLIPHSRILVATPSNSAADLIATRLINSNCLKPGDLVRFSSYRAVAENLIPSHLAPYSTTGSISKEGTDMVTVVEENGTPVGNSKTTIGRHRITVGTCASFGTLHGMGFIRGHFTHIIVDEAGQCTEPDIMIPLSFLDLKEGQAILAGDPKQLGPVVLSNDASEFGLTESYMGRMINRFPYIRDKVGFPKTNGYDPRLITLLVYNYRSLPDIFYLPNKWFYNFELRPILSDEKGPEICYLNQFTEILPNQTVNKKIPSLVFHGLNSVNCRSEDSPSWFNPDEASQIFFYVNELYRLGATAKDIGIISPYIKQVKEIREILGQAGFDLPKIGTVEEFQGQERKVILMSTVRTSTDMLSNDSKFSLGFVSNPRRLNVVLTRAQCLIIIVGNPNLLINDNYWNELIKLSMKNNSYVGYKF